MGDRQCRNCQRACAQARRCRPQRGVLSARSQRQYGPVLKRKCLIGKARHAYSLAWRRCLRQASRMAEIINLREARKARERLAKEEAAKQARALHGQKKADSKHLKGVDDADHEVKEENRRH